jgi:hypothetical protein
MAGSLSGARIGNEPFADMSALRLSACLAGDLVIVDRVAAHQEASTTGSAALAQWHQSSTEPIQSPMRPPQALTPKKVGRRSVIIEKLEDGRLRARNCPVLIQSRV